MSEEKRTIETVHKEYSQLCSQAGHIQYQIFTLSKDLALLNDQLRDLNFEASKITAADKAAKDAEKKDE